MDIEKRHNSYTDLEKERLCSFPVEKVLSLFGKLAGYKRSAKGFMCYSPFRDESSPSFSVNIAQNVWRDFGSGEHGGVLDLVCRLNGGNKGDAYDWLARQDPGFIPTHDQVEALRSRPSVPAYVVESVCRGVTQPDLLAYAARRGISAEVMYDSYQLRLHHRNTPDRPFVAIAWPNIGGGWNFRNAVHKKCTSQQVSFMDRNHQFTRIPSCDTCIVVEGFFNALTFLEMQKGSGICDIVCLNSVVNLPKAYEYISVHSNIIACLDNDREGVRHTQMLMERFPDRHIENFTAHFPPGCNDLNDYFTSPRQPLAEAVEKKIRPYLGPRMH